MRIYKIAKHASDKSFTCHKCNGNLIPSGFAKNTNHHFPWGINYICKCGESKIWTNSIRSYREFKTIVLDNKPWDSYWSGFCNDLFCAKCLKPHTITFSEFMADSNNNLYWDDYKAQKIYKVLNIRDILIHRNSKYVKNLPEMSGEEYIRKIDKNVDGKVVIKKYLDVGGCLNCNNCSIIRNGVEFEYGEGEYTPIYNWLKMNKNKIPQDMINEIIGDL